MFTIELLPAAHGDALWLEYGPAAQPHRILIDGGPAPTYEDGLRRRIGMTHNCYELLKRRYEGRETDNPWVFSHRVWRRKEKQFEVRLYAGRSRRIMTLCRKAGVP